VIHNPGDVVLFSVPCTNQIPKLVLEGLEIVNVELTDCAGTFGMVRRTGNIHCTRCHHVRARVVVL
jgi:hypothetical protein